MPPGSPPDSPPHSPWRLPRAVTRLLPLSTLKRSPRRSPKKARDLVILFWFFHTAPVRLKFRIFTARVSLHLSVFTKLHKPPTIHHLFQPSTDYPSTFNHHTHHHVGFSPIPFLFSCYLLQRGQRFARHNALHPLTQDSTTGINRFHHKILPRSMSRCLDRLCGFYRGGIWLASMAVSAGSPTLPHLFDFWSLSFGRRPRFRRPKHILTLSLRYYGQPQAC